VSVLVDGWLSKRGRNIHTPAPILHGDRALVKLIIHHRGSYTDEQKDYYIADFQSGQIYEQPHFKPLLTALTFVGDNVLEHIPRYLSTNTACFDLWLTSVF